MRPPLLRSALLLFIAPLFINATAQAMAAEAPAPTAAGPCHDRETAAVVLTRRRELVLCETGAPIARYPVALGAGGIGKRRVGDAKTPLGSYPLGPPRPSRSYGTFIPVGYPTAQQARAGFTGSAVGIHGPARAFAFAGSLNTAIDWTAGCIAVASDAEIERIATWVRARHVATVRID